MDIEYPYETGQARQQLLYLLPGVPEPRRLLLVGDQAHADLIRGGWSADVAQVAPDQLMAEFLGDVRFDAVVLSNSSDADVSVLLTAALRRLGPGGVVMGHATRSNWSRRPAALRRALSNAGFIDPTCYYLQPSVEAPMVLAPTQGPAARAHAMRAIRNTRGLYNHPAYALRMTAAWLGLDGWRRSELFFWGRRPC